MSNPLRDQLLKMVREQIDVNRTAYTAKVVRYNSDSKTIDVKLIGFLHGGSSSSDDQFSEEMVQNILILNTESIISGKPKAGDLVYIDFVNNDMSKAILLTNIVIPTSNVDNSGKQVNQSIYEIISSWWE